MVEAGAFAFQRVGHECPIVASAVQVKAAERLPSARHQSGRSVACGQKSITDIAAEHRGRVPAGIIIEPTSVPAVPLLDDQTSKKLVL